MSASLDLTTDRKHTKIPQEVKDAITEGDDDEIVQLTEELYRLAAAWDELNNRDPLHASIQLSANCGPVVISDTLNYYRKTEADTKISAIQKNGYTLYFTDDVVCDKKGNTAVSAETDAVEAAKLLDIVYELCLNGQLDITENDSGCTYSLSLDDDGMKAVACAIAPAAEDMDIIFDAGSIQVTTANGKVQNVQISCNGEVQIMLSTVTVTFAAELDLSSEGVDFDIPEEVIQALK